MGCCFCLSPNIEELRKDPSIQSCIKTTRFAQVTYYKSMPNVALKKIVNVYSGDIVYIQENNLVHISCCSCCTSRFPIKNIIKYDIVKNQSVVLFRTEAMYVDNGVAITFQETDDRFSLVVFSSPVIEEFVSHLSQNAPPQQTFEYY